MNLCSPKSPHSRPASGDPPRQAGFALLITITLLAFLVLLLVSLASLTRVETQVANNSQQLAQARQNALMALSLALGHLQQTAGPDQRVTARADILDTASTTLRNTVVKHPLWTGVWATNNPSAANQQLDTGANLRSWSTTNPAGNNSHVSWLVSGAKTPVVTPTTSRTADNTTVNPVSWTATATNSIPLADRMGPAGDITVFAPLENIQVPASQLPGFGATDTTPTTIGKYAYWVSDEGIKAKVNLQDPTYASADTALRQLHHWAPQASASHLALPMSDPARDFRDTSAAELRNIVSSHSLLLVTGVTATPASPLRRYLSDVTVHSKGVLADVRNGGLKKDLTAAFEDVANFNTFANTYGQGSSMVYRGSVNGVPASSARAAYVEPDGLFWHSLFYHYQSYKATLAAPGVTGGPSGVGDPGKTLPYSLDTRGYAVDFGGTTLRVGSLLPVVLSYRLDIALDSHNYGGTTGWKLRLHYYPQLVLYNPYSVALSLKNFQYERRINPYTAGSDGQLKGSIGPTAIQDGANAYVKLNDAANGGRIGLRTRTGDLDLLAPGETRVFGLLADKQCATIKDALTFSDLASAPSMSADFATYTDMPGFSGTTDPDALVKLALTSRAVRMNNSESLLFPAASAAWPKSLGSSRFLTAPIITGATAGAAWNDVKIKDLDSNPVHVLSLFMRFKGVKPAPTGGKAYQNMAYNLPLFHGNAAAYSVFDQNTSELMEVYLPNFGEPYLNSASEISLTTSGSYYGTTWGNTSVGVAGSNLRPVLRDVPTQPMVSLGQFMHLSALAFNSTGIYQDFSMGSMFVGGSLCAPSLNTTINAFDNGTSRFYLDDSFLANEALFDRFFFSTVPPAGSAPAGTTWPAQWTAFNTANPGPTLADASQPLLNARMKPYLAAGAPAMADLRQVEKAAANLLLDGAFNVNSTSVNAWKAFLGGLSGDDLKVYDATAGTSSSVVLSAGSTKKFPFPRFSAASTSATPNAAWSGLRVLDDTELTELATRIVEQVKLRGPFLSMADFLNRRLGPNTSALCRTGALQAAIDTTSPDINSVAKAAGVDVAFGTPPAASTIVANVTDAKGNALKTSVGMPGYLMQQDLVQACSAAMTVRSDTFVIRAYGQNLNPLTQQLQCEAWLEAVVQRIPEFVDPALAADTDLATSPSSLAKTTNEIFGRRFKVVAFRWLSPNDI